MNDYPPDEQIQFIKDYNLRKEGRSPDKTPHGNLALAGLCPGRTGPG